MYSATPIGMPKVSVPDTAQRRRRRQKTRRVRFGLSSLWGFIFNARWVSLLLLSLCVFALTLIARSERFYLTYIPISGAITVSPEQIAATSELAGKHIFAVDPSAAAEAIGSLPGVVSSTVSLTWPNQIYIAVAEEEPIALWQEGSNDYWITDKGSLLPAREASSGMLRIVSETALAAAAPRMTLELPEDESLDPSERATIISADGEEVTGDEADEPTGTVETVVGIEQEAREAVGETAVTNAAIIPAQMQFVPQDVLEGALQLRALRPTIEQLYYRPYGGLSYQDGRGWRVYFGTGTDMHQKLVVYETIVEDLLARGLVPAYVSVSNQEKPYFRVQ